MDDGRWRRNGSVEPGRRRREGRTGGRGKVLPWNARGLIQVRQVFSGCKRELYP